MKRILFAATVVTGLAVAASAISGIQAQTGIQPQQAVDAAFGKFKDLKEGKNADYIPALAKVDPNLFGIALVTALAVTTFAQLSAPMGVGEDQPRLRSWRAPRPGPP